MNEQIIAVGPFYETKSPPFIKPFDSAPASQLNAPPAQKRELKSIGIAIAKS